MPVVSLRPSSDVSVTDWETGTGSSSNLYAEIDEATVSSTDYIATEGGTAKFELTNPSAGITAATMRVRFRKDGDDEANLTVRLLQDNYPTTWNPTDKTANVSLSGGNLIATIGNEEFAGMRTIASHSSGKKYAEIGIAREGGSANSISIGFSNATQSLTEPLGGLGNNSLAWYRFGEIVLAESTIDTISGYSADDVICCLAIDFDNEKFWARPLTDANWNDDVLANQNPATNTGGVSFSAINAGPYFLTMVVLFQADDVYTLNAGASPFAGVAPAGFNSWSVGEAEIASWEYTDIADTDVDEEVALTAPQFALIINPNNLRIEFEATVDATGGAYSSEMQQFYDRTTGLDSTHLDAYEALIDGLVADGVWAKLDALYIFATEDTTNAVLNLVSEDFTVTPNGSPTFSADDGYTGEDSATPTKYLDTGFNPFVEQGTSNFQLNDGHASLWVTNAFNSNVGGIAMGNGNSGLTITNIVIAPRHLDDSSAYIRVNESSSPGVTVATAAGHSMGSRTGASVEVVYKNGSNVSNQNVTSLEAFVNVPVFICAWNEGGNPVQGFGGEIAAASIGGGLTSGEASDFYDRLRTYMTAVGVP